MCSELSTLWDHFILLYICLQLVLEVLLVFQFMLFFDLLCIVLLEVLLVKRVFRDFRAMSRKSYQEYKR